MCISALISSQQPSASSLPNTGCFTIQLLFIHVQSLNLSESCPSRKLGPESNSPGSWAECREAVLHRGFQVKHCWPFFNSPLRPMPFQGSTVVYPHMRVWGPPSVGRGSAAMGRAQLVSAKLMHIPGRLLVSAVAPWTLQERSL